MNQWVQLILEVSPEQADRLSDTLSELGAAAVTMEDGADQPLFEPAPGTTPLWRRTVVKGLFAAAAPVTDVARQLLAEAGLPDSTRWRVEAVEEKDWSRAWMDDFKPMHFGKRLWIVPSWHEAPDPGAVNILLDPGLAFGTGTHPTTRLCLEWLDSAAVEGREVIDYGCGSGILAIAAAKLGAASVLGIDTDPQALEATVRNAAENGAEGITAYLPGDEPETACDILLANILAGPLIELAPRLARLTKKGGSIVLSGILGEQAARVAEAYAPWFEMAAPVELEGWVRLCGQRE